MEDDFKLNKMDLTNLRIAYMNNYTDKPKKVKNKKSFEAKRRANTFELKMFIVFLLGILVGFIGLILNITPLVIVGGGLNLFSGLSIMTTGYRLMFDEIEESIDNIGKY